MKRARTGIFTIEYPKVLFIVNNNNEDNQSGVVTRAFLFQPSLGEECGRLITKIREDNSFGRVFLTIMLAPTRNNNNNNNTKEEEDEDDAHTELSRVCLTDTRKNRIGLLEEIALADLHHTGAIRVEYFSLSSLLPPPQQPIEEKNTLSSILAVAAAYKQEFLQQQQQQKQEEEQVCTLQSATTITTTTVNTTPSFTTIIEEIEKEEEKEALPLETVTEPTTILHIDMEVDEEQPAGNSSPIAPEYANDDGDEVSEKTPENSPSHEESSIDPIEIRVTFDPFVTVYPDNARHPVHTTPGQPNIRGKRSTIFISAQNQARRDLQSARDKQAALERKRVNTPAPRPHERANATALDRYLPQPQPPTQQHHLTTYYRRDDHPGRYHHTQPRYQNDRGDDLRQRLLPPREERRTD